MIKGLDGKVLETMFSDRANWFRFWDNKNVCGFYLTHDIVRMTIAESREDYDKTLEENNASANLDITHHIDSWLSEELSTEGLMAIIEETMNTMKKTYVSLAAHS